MNPTLPEPSAPTLPNLRCNPPAPTVVLTCLCEHENLFHELGRGRCMLTECQCPSFRALHRQPPVIFNLCTCQHAYPDHFDLAVKTKMCRICECENYQASGITVQQEDYLASVKSDLSKNYGHPLLITKEKIREVIVQERGMPDRTLGRLLDDITVSTPLLQHTVAWAWTTSYPEKPIPKEEKTGIRGHPVLRTLQDRARQGGVIIHFSRVRDGAHRVRINERTKICTDFISKLKKDVRFFDFGKSTSFWHGSYVYSDPNLYLSPKNTFLFLLSKGIQPSKLGKKGGSLTVNLEGTTYVFFRRFVNGINNFDKTLATGFLRTFGVFTQRKKRKAYSYKF